MTSLNDLDLPLFDSIAMSTVKVADAGAHWLKVDCLYPVSHDLDKLGFFQNLKNKALFESTKRLEACRQCC